MSDERRGALPVTAAETGREPERGSEASASDDTGQASPASVAQSGPRTGAVPALPLGAVLSEAIRIRLADAMYDSIDRCARCKVCEHQIGAAAKVMAEAVSTERDQAEAALRNALEGLEEMLPYVPEFFREKWDLDAYVTRARSALAIIGTEGESDA